MSEQPSYKSDFDHCEVDMQRAVITPVIVHILDEWTLIDGENDRSLLD